MKFILFLILFLPVLGRAMEDSDRKVQIQKLRQLLDTKYQHQHEEQKIWLKDRTYEKPPLDPKMKKIYLHLARLYSLTGNEKGGKFYSVLATEPTAKKSHSDFIDLSARINSHAVNIETSAGTGVRYFNAIGFGAGYTHFFSPRFTLSGTGTFGSGDIKAGAVSQKAATLYSLRGVPSYVIPAGEKFNFFVGIPFSYSKLQTGSNPDVKLSSNKQFDVGIEGALRYQWTKKYSLGVSYGYSSATRSLGIGLGYHL